MVPSRWYLNAPPHNLTLHRKIIRCDRDSVVADAVSDVKKGCHPGAVQHAAAAAAASGTEARMVT